MERNSQPKKNIKDTTILRTVESTKPPDLLVPKTQVCVVDAQWGQKYQSLEQKKGLLLGPARRQVAYALKTLNSPKAFSKA